MTINPKVIFQRNERYEGVPNINIYLLRLLYVLMFFVLGRITWTHVLTHEGPWDPANAVAWCVWTAFATLAGIGIIRPVKMLPIVLLEIFYKVQWLILVAYPTVVQGHVGGFTRGRNHLAVLVGDIAHRRCAVGIRVCELFLQTQESRTSSFVAVSGKHHGQ